MDTCPADIVPMVQSLKITPQSPAFGVILLISSRLLLIIYLAGRVIPLSHPSSQLLVHGPSNEYSNFKILSLPDCVITFPKSHNLLASSPARMRNEEALGTHCLRMHLNLPKMWGLRPIF